MTIPFVDVAIIGGGPGGLALAHGLRKHGIQTAVFERDTVRADYVQGFRLGIRQRGIDALEANLPRHLFEAFLGTVGRQSTRRITVDEKFNRLADIPRSEGREDVHSDKSVSRITLRQILLSDLGDIYQSGRAFERYEVEPEGTVLAHFADGSAVRANILVGADGAGSAVRRQLVPQYKSFDTGMRRLAGKITLADAARHGLAPALVHQNVGVHPIGGRRMSIAAHYVDPEAYARFGLIGQDDPSHRDIAGSHFDNTTSYLWWNTAYAQDELAPDAELEKMDGAQLRDVLLRHIAHWDERLLRLIRHSDPSTIALLKVRSSEPGALWETGPVTLLGDAIHPMTYFRALGGNSALFDAGLLAVQLFARKHGKPRLAAIHDYEVAMREHGYEAVRSSLLAMQRNDNAGQPVATVAAA